MTRRTPRSTRTDTLFPATTLVRSRLRRGRPLEHPAAMTRTRAAVALGLMALVAGVAGCGDDDEEPQGAVLGDQLDELAASAAGDGDTTRPEAVALCEGLIADGQADEVAAELSAWIVSRVEPHVGTDPTASVLDEALVPAAAVVAAALDGADEAEADVSSSELENETTDRKSTRLNSSH